MANSLPNSKFNVLQQAAYHLATCSDQIVQQIEQEQIIEGLTERIRTGVALDMIFQEASGAIRQLLQTDRVGIVQVDASSDYQEGTFVAENVASGFTIALGQKICGYGFGAQFVESYTQGQVQPVADIYSLGLADEFLEILTQLQVRAKLLVPILQGDNLWGLICVHQCTHPRPWSQTDIGFVQKVASFLAIALHQSTQADKLKDQAALLAKNEAQAKDLSRQKSLVKIVSQIRQSLSFDEICDIATHEVRQSLEVDRVAIYRFNPDFSGDFVVESVGKPWRSLVGSTPTIEDTYLVETQGGRYADNQTLAIDDIYAAGYSDCHIELLEQFQAKAYAIAPIFQDDHLWGLFGIYQNATTRHWQTDEIEFLALIVEQLGIVLQQINEQNKAIYRQKSLIKIVSKIRQSLAFDEICNTATAEVQQILEVNRVAIYRFNPDWSGDFVFESVDPEWKPLVDVLPTIADTYLMESQGGRYATGETFAVADIYDADHTECHRQLLKDFQARAYAIAPIFQDDCLWGLFAAFQNSMTRYWQPDEVELLAQVGEQLGIALKQAEFVAKIQAQSVALRQSQVQFIQQEKMAGLGQLVAGVAHEINNPVNFIYGNLPHVDNYVQDLLTIADVCTKVTPASPEHLQEVQAIAEDLDLEFIAEDLPKILASMQMGTERIQEIVLSLRNFSRLDEAAFKTVDIHEGIESTLLILRSRLKFTTTNEHITVVKDYGDLPPVECFPAQLNQVFMNLLANSIDAIEEAMENNKYDDKIQPTIWIQTQRETNNHITVKVRDNGIGLNNVDTSKIFDHFFTSKPIGKGTGIGLSISYEIITQKHAGTLTFHGLDDGRTEFVIQLPILASSPSGLDSSPLSV